MHSLRIIYSEHEHIIIPPWKLACHTWWGLGRKNHHQVEVLLWGHWQKVSEEMSDFVESRLISGKRNMLQGMINRLWKKVWNPQDWNNKRLCRLRFGCFLELFVLPWSHKYIGRAGAGWEQSRMLWDRAGWFICEDNACRLSPNVILYLAAAITHRVRWSPLFCSCKSCKETKKQRIWTTKKKLLKVTSRLDSRLFKTCLTSC